MKIDALKKKLGVKSVKNEKKAKKMVKKPKVSKTTLKQATKTTKLTNSNKKGTKNMEKVEKAPKSVAKQAKSVVKVTNSNQKEENMDHAKAREMALEVLVEVAKENVKTHHLGRDGHWLICDKTNEVQVGISKKGTTGLVKITMPIGKLPSTVQTHCKKAVQAFHMTWVMFTADRNIIKSAINARVKSKKTSKEYATEIYGSVEATPCWNKAVSGTKATVEDKLKALNTRKAKLAEQEKALKAEIKTRKATKNPKAKKVKATVKNAAVTA